MAKLLFTLSVLLSLSGCFSNWNFFGSSLDIDEVRPKAERGDPLAQYQMGFIYSEGLDNQPIDYDKAIYWLHKAHQGGEIRAAYQLGRVYSRTGISSEDFQIVTYWMEKSGERGWYYAQKELTDIYLSGERIPIDGDKAIYWLEKRANELCDQEAYEQLGDLYYEGSLRTGDYPESLSWYLKAAQKGRKDAMLRLADMYAEGKGVSKNWLEAYVWYTKAYRWHYCHLMYSPTSDERCVRLIESLAIAEEHLTTEQLELGRQRAEDMKLMGWTPPSCEEPDERWKKFFDEGAD